MTAEQILARAAELVEESWAQGDGHVGIEGPYCAGFALGIACASPHDVLALFQATDAFERQIGVKLGDPRAIAEWNDAPGRTQAEVATELRNAKSKL